MRESRPTAIGDEIAAANHLRRGLGGTDDGDGVERRVHCPAYQPLASDGRTDGGQRERGSDPWHRPGKTTPEPELSESDGLLKH
jgi:hypothetical protein